MNTLGIGADWRGRLNVINIELDNTYIPEMNKAVTMFIGEAINGAGGKKEFQEMLKVGINELSSLYEKTKDKRITEFLRALNNKIINYNQKIANLFLNIKFPTVAEMKANSGYWRKLYFTGALKGTAGLDGLAGTLGLGIPKMTGFAPLDTFLFIYDTFPNFAKFVNKYFDVFTRGLVETFDRNLHFYRVDTEARIKKVQMYADSISPTLNQYVSFYKDFTEDITISINNFVSQTEFTIPDENKEPVPLPQESAQSSESITVSRPKKNEYLVTPSGFPYRVKSEPTVTTIRTDKGIETVSTYEREPIVLNHANLGLIYIK